MYDDLLRHDIFFIHINQIMPGVRVMLQESNLSKKHTYYDNIILKWGNRQWRTTALTKDSYDPPSRVKTDAAEQSLAFLAKKNIKVWSRNAAGVTIGGCECHAY